MDAEWMQLQCSAAQCSVVSWRCRRKYKKAKPTFVRSILVDWLVEVQESFELNHKTLYTATDLFLSKKQVRGSAVHC
jgi:hypothetical protein